MTIVIFLALLFPVSISASSAPNIILIVADDLGYNDVSWHNPDILSPHLHRHILWFLLNIPALTRFATEGLRLEQAYVLPICTPTRSAP